MLIKFKFDHRFQNRNHERLTGVPPDNKGPREG